MGFCTRPRRRFLARSPRRRRPQSDMLSRLDGTRPGADAYMSEAVGDIPTWVMAVGTMMSLVFGSLTGAVGAAWRSAERLQAMERRLTDKLDSNLNALRGRQDQLHRENKADMQRLEDRLMRRRPT